MHQPSLRFVLMRGGTSKCLMFKANDLPPGGAQRDRVLLAAFGSPDPRQIDGLGGATSPTSKVCIIAASKREGVDIEYTFGQVHMFLPMIDYGGNCGNCSAAVGPFAVDEGLVQAQEDVTQVRILNTNTQKLIIAEVPTHHGHALYEGTYEMAGVPGQGARQRLWFSDPAGSRTGRLLPTSHTLDLLEVQGRSLAVSLVDAANPVVFVKAQDLKLRGTETAAEIDSRPDLLALFEEIRGKAAALLGLVDEWQDAATLTPGVPKVALVAAAQFYTDLYGRTVMEHQIDVVARILSMGRTHPAYALTGAIATGAAAALPGTVVQQLAGSVQAKHMAVRIGHPSGIIEVEIETEQKGEDIPHVLRASASRTARRLAEGMLYLPGRAVDALVN